MKRGLFASLILFLFAATATHAFVAPTRASGNVVVSRTTTTTATTTTTTQLDAKKKPTTVKKQPQPLQDLDPVRLVIAYMTPWRNPNSIFVYLLALLYCLGKYSEAHSSMAGQ